LAAAKAAQIEIPVIIAVVGGGYPLVIGRGRRAWVGANGGPRTA
jgi:hypothetical protein